MICKITFDVEHTNLNTLFKMLEKEKIDVCFSGDNLYLYSPCCKSKYFSYLMRKIEITNFFIKEITVRPDIPPTTYIDAWVIEKFDLQEKQRLENEQQSKLQQMMENINKVKLEWQNRQEKPSENVTPETTKIE